MDKGIDVGHLMYAGFVLGLMAILIWGVTSFAVNKLTSTVMSRFAGILLINLACSCFPLGTIGLIFGMPSAFVAAVATTLLLGRKK